MQCYLAAERSARCVCVLMSYLYFMPVLMLCSLHVGALWTDSWPRLRATMATARNFPRAPPLGLLAFCWRLSRSSVLRLMPRWSEHTNDTCMAAQVVLAHATKKHTLARESESEPRLKCTRFLPSRSL